MQQYCGGFALCPTACRVCVCVACLVATGATAQGSVAFSGHCAGPRLRTHTVYKGDACVCETRVNLCCSLFDPPGSHSNSDLHVL
jgi:hypothetical protein